MHVREILKLCALFAIVYALSCLWHGCATAPRPLPPVEYAKEP